MGDDDFLENLNCEYHRAAVPATKEQLPSPVIALFVGFIGVHYVISIQHLAGLPLDDKRLN